VGFRERRYCIDGVFWGSVVPGVRGRGFVGLWGCGVVGLWDRRGGGVKGRGFGAEDGGGGRVGGSERRLGWDWVAGWGSGYWICWVVLV